MAEKYFVLTADSVNVLQQLLKRTPAPGNNNNHTSSGSAFIAKTIATPAGETAFTNCRYWCEPQISTNADTKEKLTLSTDASRDLDTPFSATNLSEMAGDTHTIPVDTVVQMFRVISIAEDGKESVIYAFTSGGGGTYTFRYDDASHSLQYSTNGGTTWTVIKTFLGRTVITGVSVVNNTLVFTRETHYVPEYTALSNTVITGTAC